MVNILSLKDKCTGCMACVEICPRSAISTRKEMDGFLYPSIDSARCIDCGRCVKNCPSISEVTRNNIKRSYLAQAKNTEILERSASGSAFFILALSIIKTGGYVAGCVLNENLEAEHICTNEIEDIARMQGSKYVQSKMSTELFQKIEDLLKANVPVIFTGTPCQVAAIKRLFGHFEKLILVDLICHGVGSPGVFKNHLERMEKKLRGRLIHVSFREKNIAYPQNYHFRAIAHETNNLKECVYDKGELADRYYAAFAKARILRESCYSCLYANMNRVGNITLGDYLAKRSIPNNIERSKGISLICVNDETGFRLFERIKNDIFWTELDQVPYKKNLTRPEPRPRDRDLLNKYGCESSKILRRKLSDLAKSMFSAEARSRIKSRLSKFGVKFQ